MKYHIGNFKQELVENHKLVQRGDLIIFKVADTELSYTVQADHISNNSGFNDRIFDLLHIDKDEFAKKAYGYVPHRSGVWPIFSDGDYAAATRIVVALFNKIESLSLPISKKIELPTSPIPSESSGGSVKINIPKTIQPFSIKL